MKTRQKQFSIPLMLLVISFSGAYIWSVVQKVSYQPQARLEMRNLFSRIQLGNSATQVQRAFRAGNYQKLKLRKTQQAGLWSVSTPPEFGAGNWVLYLEFNDKKQVAALRIRTNDSVRERPRDTAPQDKIAPDWRKIFP